MPKLSPPVEDWELMQTGIHTLGRQRMQQIFGVGQAQLYRISRNPLMSFEDPADPTPIRRMEAFIKSVLDSGDKQTAKAIARIFAHAVGCDLECTGDIRPDKDTLDHEMLDDFQHVAAFHKAMMELAPMPVVSGLADEAVREIRETKVKYFAEFPRHIEGRR